MVKKKRISKPSGILFDALQLQKRDLKRSHLPVEKIRKSSSRISVKLLVLCELFGEFEKEPCQRTGTSKIKDFLQHIVIGGRLISGEYVWSIQ